MKTYTQVKRKDVNASQFLQFDKSTHDGIEEENGAYFVQPEGIPIVDKDWIVIGESGLKSVVSDGVFSATWALVK